LILSASIITAAKWCGMTPRFGRWLSVASAQEQQTHTALDWEVYPQGLTDILQWVASRYGSVPLYITENGAAFYDPPQADGEVEDSLRRRYLRDHLQAAQAAIANGVNLRGYFAWSLLDGFEWISGYAQRFGLIMWITPPSAEP
jgi:beta-glucosidase